MQKPLTKIFFRSDYLILIMFFHHQMCVNYSQRNANVTAEGNAKGNVNIQECTTSASFNESVVPFPQNKQSGQTR